MKRYRVKAIVAAGAVSAALVVLPSAVSAVDGSSGAGRAYGQHVSHHAREHGFSGEMNPGHHQGFAGFDEHHHHH